MPNITNFPTGRVGIGTENPQQTLDVAGTLRVTGSTGTPNSLMGRDSSGDVGVVGVGSGLGIDGFGQLYATGGASGSTSGSGSTNQVAYWTGTNVLSGENNLWWDFSADRLGIGTNAPARSLDVIGGIRFSTVNGTPTAIIGWDGSGDIGSVSIGTGLGLSAGVLSFTGSTGGSGTVTGTGTTNYLSKWASASGLTDSIVLETGNTIDINGSLRVRTSSGTATNVMGRDANGYVSNIAIGNGLSVSGGTLSTTGVTFGTGADGRVAYWTGTGVTNQIGNDNNFIWDYESDRLGIGVFPTSALHISSADSASIRIVKTGTSPADFSLVALNGKLDIGNAFTITDTGRLGLGTNAPAQTLDVAGNMRLTGSTGTSATVMGRSVDGDISAISVGSGLSLSGNVLTTTGGTSGTVTGTGTVNYLSKWASSTGLTNSIALETGNTIDIAGSLRVTTASGTATLIAGQDANGYFSRITVGSGLSLAGNTLTATGGGSGTVSGSGTATQVAFWNGTTSLTGNTNLYWDNNNNRLGIGTSSPSNQLTTTSDALISTLTIGRGNNSIGNNTAIGVSALLNNPSTLASGNTAVGYFALLSTTVGASFNTALGNLTLLNTTSGNSNTAVGSDALLYNTTGNSNTAVGRAALFYNEGGSNVAVGASALLNNVSGSTNVAVGVSAGRYSAAGTNATTVTSSIFIGGNSRASNISPSNQIVIGTSAVGLADNATVIGTTGTTQTYLYGNLTLGLTSADTTARLKATSSDGSSSSFAAKFQNNSGTDILSVRGDGVVGIGTTSPAQTLDIRGTMRLTGSTGTGTTLMARDGSGDVSAISVGSGLNLSGNTLTTTGSTGVSGSGTATQVAFWSGATGTTSTALTSSTGLTWDNTNVRLNIGNPSSATGVLNVRSSGSTLSTSSAVFTNSNNSEVMNVRDDNYLSVNKTIAVGNPTTYGDAYILGNGASEAGGTNLIRIIPAPTNSCPTIQMLNTGTNTTLPCLAMYAGNISANAPQVLFIGRGGFSGLSSNVAYLGALVNGSSNANSLHLGFNVSNTTLGRFQAMQIWNSGNVVMQNGGTYTDSGYKLDIVSTNSTHGLRVIAPNTSSGTNAILVQNTGSTNLLRVEANGDISFGTALNWNATNTRLGIGTASPSARLHVVGSGTTTGTTFLAQASGGTETFRILDNGNVGVNIASPTARLYVKGSTSGNGSTAFEVTDNTDRDIINVRDDGRIALGRNLASNVQNSVTLEAFGDADTDIGIAIVPKGAGGITASIPDNAITGGVARGSNAIDLQMFRISVGQVASGAYSTIVGGQSNTSSGLGSFVGGGSTNIASGTNSSVNGGNNNKAQATGASINGGYGNTVNGLYGSVSGGNLGNSYLYGQNVIGSGAFGSGDAQTSNLRLWAEITGSGETELFLDGSTERALLTATRKVWQGNIQLVATVQNIGTSEITRGDTYSVNFVITIKKNSTTTTMLSYGTANYQILAIANDSSMSTAVWSVSADDGNDALKLTFKPPSNFSATTKTRVVATVYLTEVAF